MTRTYLRLASTCAGILLGAVAARATIVVDASGAGEFTSLEVAIAAAADGEQILVKSGTYLSASGLPLVISGKGLSIVADAGAVVVLQGLHIQQLPAGHWVVLRGLTLDGTLAGQFTTSTALQVDGPGGTVWAEDCTLRGNDGFADPFWFLPASPGNGARVQAESDLTLQRCTIQGGRGWNATGGIQKWFPGNGAAGVAAIDGRVALLECTVTGGDVGPGDSTQFGNPFITPVGGAGVEIVNTGFAHVSGSSLTGGKTGTNLNIPDDQSGAGLLMYGASPKAWLRDSGVQAGAVVNAGVEGPDITAPAGAVTTLTAPARSFSVPSPLREGQQGVLQVQGQVGDQVVVLVTLGAGFTQNLAKQGVVAVDASILLLPIALGAISDPGGSLNLPFVTPPLNPVLSGLTVPMQLAVIAGGVTTFEAGSALAWLDSSL